MFNCEFCHRTTKPGERCTLVTVESRQKAYAPASLPKREGENFERSGRPGTGVETIRALRACTFCAQTERSRVLPLPAPEAVNGWTMEHPEPPLPPGVVKVS